MKKKLLLIALCFVAAVGLMACGDSSSPGSDETKAEEKVYGVGDTWEVDGQWKLTINSATPTDARNEYADKEAAQVIIVEYTYENLGYVDSNGIMDGLYFDLSSQQIVDEKGTMGYSYPGDIQSYPQEVPEGANCTAQACIGVDNESSKLKIIVSNYDGNDKDQKATFEIPVK